MAFGGRIKVQKRKQSTEDEDKARRHVCVISLTAKRGRQKFRTLALTLESFPYLLVLSLKFYPYLPPKKHKFTIISGAKCLSSNVENMISAIHEIKIIIGGEDGQVTMANK